MTTLILYPHGIGDLILASPVFEHYAAQNGPIALGMLNRFKSTELYRAAPFVQHFVYTADPWNDFKSFPEGFSALVKECADLSHKHGWKFKAINHTDSNHKMEQTARVLGVSMPKDRHTRVHLRGIDFAGASWFLESKGLKGKPFGFAHTSSPSKVARNKNVPEDYADKWLRMHRGVETTLNVKRDLGLHGLNFLTICAIAKQAAATFTIDSAYFHALAAMDKKIDFAYFPVDDLIYNKVKPLHPVVHTVYHSLPKL